MDSISLPAPYKGVDEINPVAVIQSPNCEDLYNFNPDQGGLVLRNGDSKYSKFTHVGLSGSNGGFVMGLFSYGENTKLILLIRDRGGANTIDFVNADSGAVEYTSAGSGATTSIVNVYFNKSLYFYGNTSTLAPGIKYDGAAWAGSGYTGTNLWPIGGNVYNHRQYLIQLAEAAYWYTGIDSTSGACTKVDISGLTNDTTTLSSIGTFTHITPYGAARLYQAFVMANGEVLFYTGSYPDGSDWSLEGKANIAQPLSPNSVILYNYDTLILTDAGIVSLRDLFLSLRDSTQTGDEQSPYLTKSAPVQKSWNALVKAIRTSLGTPIGPIIPSYGSGVVRGVFDKKNNRIVVSFPYYLTRYPASAGTLSNGSFFFIYDNQFQSWYFHRSFGGRIYDICRYKNSIKTSQNLADYDPTFVICDKEGSSGFMDRNYDDTFDVAFDYDIRTAPIPYPKTGVYQTLGVEPIIQSDLYAQTKYNLIANFGQSTTGDQTVDALTTAPQKPLANVGITELYTQLFLYGTTTSSKTVGLKLYGYNVWVDRGEEGSR